MYGHMSGFPYVMNRLKGEQIFCDACGQGDPGTKLGWSIDHDHTTEQIRGVICRRCNSAIGHAEDSIPRLEALIAYLKDPPELRKEAA